MKTLKISRLLSLIATLVFMLIAFLPEAINETDDWIMIVVLAVAFVAPERHSLRHPVDNEWRRTGCGIDQRRRLVLGISFLDISIIVHNS